jgi:hypothetical protein
MTLPMKPMHKKDRFPIIGKSFCINVKLMCSLHLLRSKVFDFITQTSSQNVCFGSELKVQRKIFRHFSLRSFKVLLVDSGK